MVLVAGLLRRWWLSAAVIAMLAAGLIGWLHAAALRDSGLEAGRTRELTIVLTTPARQHDGMSGPWWTAQGRILAGADRVPVGVTGSGAGGYGAGDRLRGVMAVSTSDTPGEAARVRIRGAPLVVPSHSWAAGIRQAMRSLSGESDPGWLLSGMTLGMDEGLSAAAAQDMRTSGLTHLTAVSGANCAILVLLVLWVCGWLHVGRSFRALAAGAALIGFVVVVGPAPSVLRASTMAVLSLIAGIVGGRRAAAHVLQVSAVLLLMADPWLAYSVGFMLSIAATAGLIVMVERGPLAATVAAQIATFPILLAIGASVGIKSVVTNVLVAPLAAVIPVVGLMSLAAQSVAGAGAPLAAVGRLLTSMVLWVATLPLPAGLPWIPGAAGVLLAALVTAAVFVLGRRRPALTAVLLVGAVSLTVRLGDRWPPPDWWLVACDVGQGDGLVARSDAGTMVVDAGPDPAAMDGCLSRLGVRSIDLLVLTHFHADHVAGLAGVLHGRSVGQVWMSACDEPPEEFQRASAALGSVPVSIPGPGSVYQFGDSRMQVVSPQRVIRAGSVPNNSSVAFLLLAPQGRVAFLADMESEAQSMAMRSADLSADVVKVAHHGSANFDPRLPGAVQPGIALISVGAGNTYGHPAPETLAAWQATGSTVFTTMDNGDIAVTRDRQVVVRGLSRQPTR